jgi:hypothetical protein
MGAPLKPHSTPDWRRKMLKKREREVWRWKKALQF